MDTTRDDCVPSLLRGLGLWSAIAVVVGSMIGQAIFLVDSDVARELGRSQNCLVPATQILFGTDNPFVPFADTAEGMMQLGLSEDDLRKIGRENALTLLPRLNKLKGLK